MMARYQDGIILQRVETSGQLLNKVLLDREIAYERSTGRYKIGDGKTTWANLPYADWGSVAALNSHINN